MSNRLDFLIIEVDLKAATLNLNLNLSDPHVKLYDKNGNMAEMLSITKWNTDTVQEFFETHLEETEDYLKTNRI